MLCEMSATKKIANGDETLKPTLLVGNNPNGVEQKIQRSELSEHTNLAGLDLTRKGMNPMTQPLVIYYPSQVI